VNANDSLHPWKVALGSQIRDARKKVGLSQEALGDALGMTRQIVQRYEAGSDAPSVNVLGKIALKLSMTEVNINGYRFAVMQPSELSNVPKAEQLKLDFDKEYVFSGATVKIKATPVGITVTAIAPAVSA
jgi:transcriptional regulator with XRE-family HTH domain